MKLRVCCVVTLLLLAGGCSSQPVRRVTPPSLALGKTTVAHEGVTLNWEIDASAADDEWPTRVVRYAVERKPTGSDTWTTLTDSGSPHDRSFTDANIEPRTRYTYRLTCTFTDATSAAPPDPDRIGMTSAVTGPIETFGIWKLTVHTALKGQVYLTIEKFDRKLGRRVEKKHIHHAGDQIGWWKEAGSAGLVSTHRVSLGGGRVARVDFNTGMTLVSVEKKMATMEFDKCEAIYGPGGQLTGCKQSKVTATILNTYEIVTVDDEGRHVLFHPDPAKNPRLKQQRCLHHGGEETPHALLLEADRIWRSDPEKAIPIYRRLLDEFGETERVRVSRTRIRLRAEQDD